MQKEFNSLTKELSNIVENTSFGGAKLLNNDTAVGKFANGVVNFQIGADSTEKMDVNLTTSLGTMHTAIQGATVAFDGGTAIATNTATAGEEIADDQTLTPPSSATGASNANATIGNLQTAIEAVSTVRSEMGAAANRLNHVYNNLANVSTNTKNATGRIMDVDFATESSNMTAKQMLMQAGTAMLKQTNSMSSMVMSLLQ